MSYFGLQHKVIAHSFPILPVALVSLALGSLDYGHRPEATGNDEVWKGLMLLPSCPL